MSDSDNPHEAPAIKRMAQQFCEEEDARIMAELMVAPESRPSWVHTPADTAKIPHRVTPDGQPVPQSDAEEAFKIGRRSGKTELTTELMRQDPTYVLGLPQKAGMSHSAAAAVFHAAYGAPDGFDMEKFRAAAQSLHDATVPLAVAKQRVMDAMEKLSPEDIPVVQRELARLRAAHIPLDPAAIPRNRAERRRAAKKARRS